MPARVAGSLYFMAAGLAAVACGNRSRAFLEEDAGRVLPTGAQMIAREPLPAATPASSPAVAPPALVRLEPVSFAPIAHAADPSVVTIYTLGEQSLTHRAGRQESLGTGFVVDKGGIILTNNHVIESARAIQVKLSDEREYAGKVVATDPPTDIAVVRIEAKDLRPLPLGDSDVLEVGDWVVAIGNPFGLSHTVSAGIISAKGRQDVKLDSPGYYDFLQTDASINPGNSGGPLLNLSGQVVGMNSAMAGGGAQGIGFAIPINMIKQLLPMLLRDGRVTRSALGVHVMDARQLTLEDRRALKLGEGEKVSGAVILDLVGGGAAARAGLEPGDIIVAFDGQPIERSTQLQWAASIAGVGRSATLRIRRAGALFDIGLTLRRLDEGP
jgi:serine protease Do